MATIYLTDSQGSGYEYELPQDGCTLTLGSAEDCSILLPESEGVAPLHGTICLTEEGYVLSDAGSGAGIFANEEPVESVLLVPEAMYRLGNYTLQYAEFAAQTAPAPEEGDYVAAEEAYMGETAVDLGTATPEAIPPAPEEEVYTTPSEEEVYAAPAEEPAPPEQPAPLPPKKKKKKSGSEQLRRSAMADEVEITKHFKGENPIVGIFNRVYVVAILAAALLAGMSLRYWLLTGEFLPYALMDK